MAKLWDARFSKAENGRVNDFNSSISFDSRMFREDIAGSIAHDCHNIVAVGSNDLTLVQAINRVIALKGARVAVSPDGIVDLPLPIAGIMSDRPFPEVAERMEQLLDTARQIGCPMQAPFMTISFMCLPVIHELKITDRMLLDTRTMTSVTTERRM